MRAWEQGTEALHAVAGEFLPHIYMLHDVWGSFLATFTFAAVLYAPGYLACFGTNLFGFRKLTFPERSLWAIAASFCIAPIAAHLAGRAGGLTAVCTLFLAATAATALTLVRERHVLTWPRRDCLITAGIACGLLLFVLLMLIDFQVGRKLFFSVVLADESYRIAFIDTVVRTGIPPANPLYFAGASAPMRYYYFWYVLCAAVVRLAHVSSAQAYIASCVWAGFGLLATLKLYTLYFFSWSRKQSWIALALLAVTGADLVPALGQAILQPALNGDTEWWSVDPIDAWPDSLLWVPHHVASVLCCLLAFLCLWRMRETLLGGRRRWALCLAACAFASGSGLSVYVAFGFALLMLTWLVRLFAVRDAHRARLTQAIVLAGLLSAMLLTPFLRELASGTVPQHASVSPHTVTEPQTHVFVLSVRRMIDSGLLAGLPVFSHWDQVHPVLLDQCLRLLLLLPGLAMELGVYGAVLVLLLFACRHSPSRDEAHNTALFLTLAGLVMTMFLSSSVITNNDFGYRAVMLPQFFLLLLTAELLISWQKTTAPYGLVPRTPAKARLVYTLLALGVVGSVYWAILLRAWLPLETTRTQNGFTALPEDAFQIREAFDVLHRVSPRSAVVAFRPIDVPPTKQEVMAPVEYYQRLLVANAGRQMLNAEGKCAVHFGGDPVPCSDIQNATRLLYASPAPDASSAVSFCRRFGVHYLVLSAWDPNWGALAGWPASLPLVAAEPRFKLFACMSPHDTP